MTQAENPRVSYSGQAYDPFATPTGSGQYELYRQGEDGGRNLYYDTGTGQLFYAEDEGYVAASTGGDDSRSMYASGYRDLEEPAPFNSYADAKDVYSGGYIPWNIDNVYEGLSSREPFNLNALWGGTQYARGRVTDWSHIDPTQYKANVIAANTRNELWNEYEALKAQGKTPAKNPDEVALDFYVKNVGQNGSYFGYGPGINTALITEAVKHQFLNSPDVVQARGSTYQTPQEKMADIDAFGAAHQAGVPTWQVFERQGFGSGFNIGSLIPMIIGGMALGPLAGAFGGGLAGNALAGALIGGTTAEIGGGDFMKGALTGGIGAGLTSGLSGISSQVAEQLQVSPSVANAITKAAATAVTVGAAGGDVEQAIIGSLVNSGVGGAVSGGLSGAEIPPDLVKTISNIATPVISTAIQGGDVVGALTNSLIKGGLSAVKDASWGVNPQSGSGGDAEAQDYYESLGYDPETIKQLYEGTYSGSEQTEAEAREQMGDLYDLAYPDGFPTSSSSYEGLGYDANTINQLINGTYSGPEQTEAEAREQMGDLYDLAYPDGFPTSSSSYEGLGYDANTINQLMEGPSATLNEDGTYTYGGYSGPEQTEAEVREQMGDELFNLAYPNGYNAAVNITTGGTGGGAGGTGGGTGGTGGGTTGGGLASTLKNVNESLFPKDQGSSAVVPMSSLRPTTISTGQPTQSNTPEYSQIISQLASILGKRGYKVGGSVHVPGPEGRFYEKHETRGFAVGGPGTGQSDDIPTMLSDGEYVFDADTVAALGDGSSKAGAKVLDLFREEIRNHKRSASTDRIPPKAKNPLAYLKAAQKAKG